MVVGASHTLLAIEVGVVVFFVVCRRRCCYGWWVSCEAGTAGQRVFCYAYPPHTPHLHIYTLTQAQQQPCSGCQHLVWVIGRLRAQCLV